MSRPPVIIRMRWWGHLVSLFSLVVVLVLGGAMGTAALDLLRTPGAMGRGLALMALASLNLPIGVHLPNGLFFYRIEVDAQGIAMLGNFWARRITWQEITRIERRINSGSAIGYHVRIEVDGSNLPRRDWRNLGAAGYFIPTAAGRGPRRLAAYLKRKRRENLRRQRAAAAASDG